jgi:hypothetical protein
MREVDVVQRKVVRPKVAAAWFYTTQTTQVLGTRYVSSRVCDMLTTSCRNGNNAAVFRCWCLSIAFREANIMNFFGFQVSKIQTFVYPLIYEK